LKINCDAGNFIAHPGPGSEDIKVLARSGPGARLGFRTVAAELLFLYFSTSMRRTLPRLIHKAAPNDWFFPVPVHFGAGAMKDLPMELSKLNAKKPLIVTDKGLAEVPFIMDAMNVLESAGMKPALFAKVDANPTDLNIEAGAQMFREHEADAVVAIGGGSGLDAGKAISMVCRSGVKLELFDWTLDPPSVADGVIPPGGFYPETRGEKKIERKIEREYMYLQGCLTPHHPDAFTVITIPTTAGTGAEMDSASMYTDTGCKVR